MNVNICVNSEVLICIILAVTLSNNICNGNDEDAIDSFGIKSQVGNCNFKSGPNGLQQQYCYIDNNAIPGLAQYFKDEQAKTGTKCNMFDLSDFNENSSSIMYGEASGRMGNQLLFYAMMHQLG